MDSIKLVYNGISFELPRKDLMLYSNLWDLSLNNNEIDISHLVGNAIDEDTFFNLVTFIKDKEIFDESLEMSEFLECLRAFGCNKSIFDSLITRRKNSIKDYVIKRNGVKYFVNFETLYSNSWSFKNNFCDSNLAIIQIDDVYSDQAFSIFLDFMNDVSVRIPKEFCWEVYQIARIWDCRTMIRFIPKDFMLDPTFLFFEIEDSVSSYFDENQEFFLDNISTLLNNRNFCSLSLSFLIRFLSTSDYMMNKMEIESFCMNVFQFHGYSAFQLVGSIKSSQSFSFSIKFDDEQIPSLSIKPTLMVNSLNPIYPPVKQSQLCAFDMVRNGQLQSIMKLVPRRIDINLMDTNILFECSIEHYYILHAKQVD